MRFSILNSRRKQELDLFHQVPATLRRPRQMTTIDASDFLNPNGPRYKSPATILARNMGVQQDTREEPCHGPGSAQTLPGSPDFVAPPSKSESRHLVRGKPHDLHQGGSHANQGKEGLALLKRTFPGQVVPRYLIRI